jgi:GAF domain-containing protein
MLRSGTLDLKANPITTVLSGPIGSRPGPNGWPSGRRGTGAMPPAHLDMDEQVKPIEQHGFTLVDFMPVTLVSTSPYVVTLHPSVPARSLREFVALATSGKSANIIPAGYRQNSEKGLLGRVARLKKTQLVNETNLDPDFIPVNNEKTLSEIVVPIMQNGQIKGIIEVCYEL